MDAGSFIHWMVWEGVLSHHGPQLLIWDSHSSHETLEVLGKARRNDIIVFTALLPPLILHTTCALWPGVFSPFQRAFDDECSMYMNASAETIVCGLLEKAYHRGFTRSNIVSGFESTGIWKFIPETICTNSVFWHGKRPTASQSTPIVTGQK